MDGVSSRLGFRLFPRYFFNLENRYAPSTLVAVGVSEFTAVVFGTFWRMLCIPEMTSRCAAVGIGFGGVARKFVWKWTMCFPDFEETGVNTSNRLQCPSLSVQPAVAIVTETTRHTVRHDSPVVK